MIKESTKNEKLVYEKVLDIIDSVIHEEELKIAMSQMSRKAIIHSINRKKSDQ